MIASKVSFFFLAAVFFLSTRAFAEASSQDILRWIDQLGSESFLEREGAGKNLEALGDKAELYLRKALNHPDLEVRRRVQRIWAPPREYDLRKELKGLTPVRTQLCGDPYSIATVGAMETAIKMKEGLSTSLSPQHITSCNGEEDGCTGSSLPHLPITEGFVLEKDFPYAGQNISCKRGLPIFRKAARWEEVALSRRAIQTAVIFHGAVLSTFYATREFADYRGGIFKTCVQGHSQHVVSIVGWSEKEGYWIIRNTWGEEWGEKGYARILFECNHLGQKDVNALIYIPPAKPPLKK